MKGAQYVYGLTNFTTITFAYFFNCVETMDRITCGLIVVRISLVLSMLITTKVVRLNPSHGEVYSIKHYVIKFVSGLRQVGGSFRVLLFPPPPPPPFLVCHLDENIKLRFIHIQRYVLWNSHRIIILQSVKRINLLVIHFPILFHL